MSADPIAPFSYMLSGGSIALCRECARRVPAVMRGYESLLIGNPSATCGECTEGLLSAVEINRQPDAETVDGIRTRILEGS